DSCVCHDTPRPDLYTLSLPDALPIFLAADDREHRRPVRLELGRTDAPEEPELAQVLGPGLGDGREGGVVQDGVRRLAHRRGHLAAPGAQPLEERGALGVVLGQLGPPVAPLPSHRTTAASVAVRGPPAGEAPGGLAG